MGSDRDPAVKLGPSDIQIGRELNRSTFSSLYEAQLFGKQCITPVAIMTSSAKNNHERVMSLCESHSWFGRGRSTFQLFEQVPY